MKKAVWLIFAAAFAISAMLAVGCKKQEPAQEPAEQSEPATAETAPPGEEADEETAHVEEHGEALTVGVSLLKENDDFYITLKKGLAEGAREYGFKIEILSADSDEEKQSKNVDALLSLGIDALVICPVNSKGVGAIIQKASDKGIPAFTADIAAETGEVVAHVASDNYQGGQIAAERLKKEIGSGKVAVVMQPGTESVAQRVKGFKDKAAELGLSTLDPELNGKDDVQESERAVNAAITQNPDLKGVFAANDNMAMGSLAAIKASGKSIVLIGYDAAPAAQQEIKSGGPWKADVIQYPEQIGKMTIEAIHKFFNGEIEDKPGSFETIPAPVGIFDAGS